MPKPETLAMMKMEKNFTAVLEKNYPRYPYERYDVFFLLMRLREELQELERALKEQDFPNAKWECADISNIIDYIFERICQLT